MDRLFFPIEIGPSKNPDSNAISIEFKMAAGDVPFGVYCEYEHSTDILSAEIRFSTCNEPKDVKRLNEDLIIFYGKNSGRIYNLKLEKFSHNHSSADIKKYFRKYKDFLSELSGTYRQNNNIKTGMMIGSQSVEQSLELVQV